MYKNQFNKYIKKKTSWNQIYENLKKKDKKKISNENTSHLSCIS